MTADLNFFSTYSPRLIGEDRIFRAAVCIPLISNEDDYDILFEIRANTIPDQPGDICLPGGHMEAGETPVETALRELEEELLVRPEQLQLLGPSDIHHTESLIVYPYVGILTGYENTFCTQEVAEVFRVPLSWFKENPPEEYPVHSTVEPGPDFPYDRIQGGRNYKWRDRTSWQYFYQYGPYTIWGLTAKIIRAFNDLL